ncbi:hypothetical protein EFK44_12510, partial [Lactococcus lactis subsp. lactis]|nr:hypothetical protein [Lactococcus lactis subsp. lactis]MCT0086577.1 hypothetical protein [Lactococcus lactis subsp. lactis]
KAIEQYLPTVKRQDL